MADREVPVLIVGGGPAGLATALFLRRHGIECLLAERHPGTSPLPRATGIHARSMELFREAGIEQQVRDAGLALVSGAEAGDDGAISRVILRAKSLSQLEEAAVMEIGEPFSRDLSPCEPVWCGQDLMEPELLAGAAALGADLRFNTEVSEVSETEAGVRATLRDRTDGSTSTVTAQYLVAADGVDSGVRTQLGIGRSGAGVLDYMISVQFRADLKAVIGDRRFILAFLMSKDINGVAVCLDGKDHWMVWTAVKDVEDQAAFDDARCLALAQSAIGRTNVPLTVTGVFDWQTTHLIADSFRSGRYFLVGDAAHTHPPHGGFGANAGMQDAHNLAWKLAAVLNGEAGEGLLDTYGDERRVVGQATADQALIRERHRQSAAKDPGFRNFANVIVGYRYGSAAIQGGSAGGLELDDALPATLQLDATPGTRLPHVWLTRAGAQISSLDLTRGQLTLLVTEPNSAWLKTVTELDVPIAVQAAGADFDDPDGVFAASAELTAGAALLVRPDNFVAWRLTAGDDASRSTQLQSAVDAVLCRAAVTAG